MKAREQINKLKVLKGEFININKLYNEKLNQISDLNNQIDNYDEDKKHRKVWVIMLFLFIGFYALDNLLEAYIAAYSSIQLVTQIIATVSFILGFQGANGAVVLKLNDLKELLKTTEEECKKLYPELCKKREEYQTLAKTIDDYTEEYDEELEVAFEDATPQISVEVPERKDNKQIKTLSLSEKH